MFSISWQEGGGASSLSEDKESCIEDLTFVHGASTLGHHLCKDAPPREGRVGIASYHRLSMYNVAHLWPDYCSTPHNWKVMYVTFGNECLWSQVAKLMA